VRRRIRHPEGRDDICEDKGVFMTGHGDALFLCSGLRQWVSRPPLSTSTILRRAEE